MEKCLHPSGRRHPPSKWTDTYLHASAPADEGMEICIRPLGRRRDLDGGRRHDLDGDISCIRPLGRRHEHLDCPYLRTLLIPIRFFQILSPNLVSSGSSSPVLNLRFKMNTLLNSRIDFTMTDRKLVALGIPWDVDTEGLREYMSKFWGFRGLHRDEDLMA
ncbi:unnamed protein product [Fraxinus pennsylvanica]|uniref:Uncharacterized protein n=1 Tax=Fraxinus pennsylvanica TaxID=56036 RepID=A0AAD1ZBE2_9LAMI|nr:unnamed protein product [Fraxinus pennsylvanica]